MALIAHIQFGSNITKRYFKEYLVCDCNIIHRRPYNKFCPEGCASCERLEVSVISPGRDDLDLYEWYSAQNSQASDGESEHVIFFEDARCFSLTETYDAGTSRRRILKLAIEAEHIIVDDVKIKRY